MAFVAFMWAMLDCPVGTQKQLRVFVFLLFFKRVLNLTPAASSSVDAAGQAAH
jgi:hypothetical protein